VIAVDTNVLVRLFVADEPAQASKAQKLFDAAADREIAVWVSDTVLVELVWTLGRAYARERAEMVKALRALASHATVVLESPQAVRDAADAFERGPADFADCLLSVKARAAGCDQLATFDRGMRGLPGVRLL
jgi:predicted nucleic-acid-binding protein